LSSGDNCCVSPKFKRAWARCWGLRATHSLIRLCSLVCSSPDILGKFFDSASHLRFCASLIVSHVPASGVSACCSAGFNSRHKGLVNCLPLGLPLGLPLEAVRAEAGRLAGVTALAAGWAAGTGAAAGGSAGVWAWAVAGEPHSASHNPAAASTAAAALEKGRESRQETRGRCIVGRL
jgi:hypothetical protein